MGKPYFFKWEIFAVSSNLRVYEVAYSIVAVGLFSCMEVSLSEEA
jgi:hypothetical protein